MSTRAVPDLEELLAHVSWVRSLALQVAGDVHLADDLTQDALLVALTARGERPRSLRRWLAAVVKNLGRTRRRSEGRRGEREAARETPGAAPSALDLVERAATQRTLVGALLELEEPYRSTLLARFFEGRTVREIARHEGLSASAVAGRTAEGLARLRARLVRGAGREPEAWLSVLAPLVRWTDGERAPRPPASTGVLAMGLKTKLALALLLVALPIVAVRAALRSPEPFVSGGEAALPAESAGGPVLAGAPEPQRPAAPATRTAVLDPAARTEGPVRAAAPQGVPADPGAAAVRGLCLTLDGEPVPGVEVVAAVAGGRPMPRDAVHARFLDREPSEPLTARTDARGAFELPRAAAAPVRARDERYATVLAGQAGLREGRDALVVVGWRVPLAGEVVDEEGLPVSRASVQLRIPADVVRRPELARHAWSPCSFETRSDEAGRFEVEEAAWSDQARLAVEARGFLPTLVDVPEGGSLHLVVVMRRWAPDVEAVAGRVLLEDGRPAEGARVSFGWESVESDALGRFVLRLSPWIEANASSGFDPDAPLEIRATLRGRQPARATLPSVTRARAEGWPRDVELVLGPETLSLAGRVVDEEGRPLSGITVALAEPETFGLMKSEPGFLQLWTVDEASGGGAARTGQAGAFELRGLSGGPYRIEVLDEDALQRVVTEPLRPPRKDLELVLDRRALGRLEGRLVDRAGEPVVGVRVAVTARGRRHLPIGRSCTTDEHGRFRLEDVDPHPDYLRIEGGDVVPELFRELPPDAEREHLELVVARRCELQVEWDAWCGRADELVLVDTDGRRLELMDLNGASVTPLESIRVEGGPSPVLTVPDTAVEGLLVRDGRELERVTLNLVPGELVQLRL